MRRCEPQRADSVYLPDRRQLVRISTACATRITCLEREGNVRLLLFGGSCCVILSASTPSNVFRCCAISQVTQFSARTPLSIGKIINRRCVQNGHMDESQASYRRQTFHRIFCHVVVVAMPHCKSLYLDASPHVDPYHEMSRSHQGLVRDNAEVFGLGIARTLLLPY